MMRLLLKVVLLCILAASPAAAERILGVNRAAIAWVKPDSAWQATIDQMANEHVPALRMMLVSPFSKSLDVVAYANRKGIDVVLTIPATLQDFYAPDNEPRPASRDFPRINRLSKIDINRFQRAWAKVLHEIEDRRLTVRAVQIGTEYNSANFNGDLPILPRGAILSSRTAREYAFWPDYEAGMHNLSQMVQIVSASVRTTQQLKGTSVILGALARPDTSWLQSSGNVLVEPEVALRTLLSFGVDRYVDAYSVHIYPHIAGIPRPAQMAALNAQFNSIFSPLTEAAGKSKPWWITEWGITKDRAGPSKKGARLPLYCAYLAVLDASQWSALVPATFIYDWDESPIYRVWDGQMVLGTGTSIFEAGSKKACPAK